MSIVVDLAEEVSSQKLTAIKALRCRNRLFCCASTSLARRSLECKKKFTLSSGSHLIELRE
jgi:hypothetical protein